MPRKLAPDLWLFGVAVVLLSVGVVMVYSASAIVSGDRFPHPYFFLKSQLCWPLLAPAVPLIAIAIWAAPYRLRRITAFLDPWSDPRGSGFQIIQSWLAFGNGGVLGQGIGASKQKLFYLPEAHTDFIFAIVGEE